MDRLIEENYWGVYNSVILKQIVFTNNSHQKKERNLVAFAFTDPSCIQVERGCFVAEPFCKR